MSTVIDDDFTILPIIRIRIKTLIFIISTIKSILIKLKFQG